jgi:hypothetical protein
MGRSRVESTSADYGFINVLGSHRGLRGRERAQRDLEDERERALVTERAREDALTVFTQQVRELGQGDGSVVELLAREQRLGPQRLDLPGLQGLDGELGSKAWLSANDEFAAIATIGDPWGWPGLTAPAITAFGWLLENMEKMTEVDHVKDCHSRVCARAIKICYWQSGYGEKYYQRLAPLTQGIGVFLTQAVPTHLLGDDGHPSEDEDAWLAAAVALSMAPASVLKNSMRNWVEMFAGRIEDRTLSKAIIEELRWRGGIEQDKERMRAYAPVLAQLRQIP